MLITRPILRLGAHFTPFRLPWERSALNLGAVERGLRRAAWQPPFAFSRGALTLIRCRCTPGGRFHHSLPRQLLLREKSVELSHREKQVPGSSVRLE
jgi:hypothetical protein